MIYAIVNDNMVKEIREISENDFAYLSGMSQAIVAVDGLPRMPKVGWIYEKGTLFPNIKDITPRQARQAIVLSGYSIETIEGAINSLPEPNRSLALIEWEYSTAFIRRNPLVDQIGAVLGLTADQVDELWTMGSRL